MLSTSAGRPPLHKDTHAAATTSSNRSASGSTPISRTGSFSNGVQARHLRHHQGSIDPLIDPNHMPPQQQPAYFVDILERVRKFPFKGWGGSRFPNDPPQYADGTGSVSRPFGKVNEELPPQCEWLTDWEIVEDEEPEGEIIPAAVRSQSASLPQRVKRDVDGWRYGKSWEACWGSDEKSGNCRFRTHRRVFKFKPGQENLVEVFPPLFRCLIIDERFGSKTITFDMIRDANGSDTASEAPSGHRGRAGSCASSAASTAPDSVLLFNYLPDDHTTICMDNTCGKPFTTFRRRHHCRSCGLIYCNACAPKRPALDNVRICNPCNAMDQQRKDEMNKDVAARQEEISSQKVAQAEAAAAGRGAEAAPPAVGSGALMLKFQIQQNQNLEPVIRQRIIDEEDKALTALAVRWLIMILPADEEAEAKDKWEAARRTGGRSGVATLFIKEAMDIDKAKDPSTFVVVSHDSRPDEEFRSETFKKSSNPKYRYKVTWAIYDDRKPFTILIKAEKALGKPKTIARGSFVPVPSVGSATSRRVEGSLYVETGMEDVGLKAPIGTADMPGHILVEWRIEYRDTMEESNLEFCPECGRVVPHACICEPEVRRKVAFERQFKIDEEEAMRGQVTSERLIREYLNKEPHRPEGGSRGQEARELLGIGLTYGMQKYPPLPPSSRIKKKGNEASVNKVNMTPISSAPPGESEHDNAAAALLKSASMGAITGKLFGPSAAEKEKAAKEKEARKAEQQRKIDDANTQLAAHKKQQAAAVAVEGPDKTNPDSAPKDSSSPGGPSSSSLAPSSRASERDTPIFGSRRREAAANRAAEGKRDARPRRGQKKEESGCCNVM